MDEFDRLGLEIERDCLITTFEETIKKIGSERTILILRPYFEISGKTFVLNLTEWEKDDGVFEKVAKTIIMGQMPFVQKCNSFQIKKGEAFFESEGCPFMETEPGICECFCSIFTNAFAQQIDPDLIVGSIPGTRKDPKCRWRFHYTNSTLSSDFFNRDLDVNKILMQIPEEESGWRAHHYTGGVWEMVTHALVEKLGPELMIEILQPRMRRIGFAYGLKIKNQFGIEGGRINSLMVAMNVFGRSIRQTHHQQVMGGDELAVSVVECPFRNDLATSTHCFLIECINDGICKAIDPDYKFQYESMTTVGDDVCRWSVSHSSNERKNDPSSKVNEEPLMVLKHRLAKGEISIEQYERISKFLY